MDRTTNLSLSLMQPNQAAKHITVNEGLVVLDRAAQLRLRGLDRSDPPSEDARVPGDTYATAQSPTGAWAGQPHSLAIDLGTQWRFIALQPGFHGVDLDSSRLVVWDGGAWQFQDSGSTDQFATLGIGTPPAAGQALTVEGGGSLFTHAGTDVRQSLNRAGQDDVCSVVFQTGFQAGAEVGLVGDSRLALRTFGPDGTATEHCSAHPDEPGVSSACYNSRVISVAQDEVVEVVPPRNCAILAICNRREGYPQANYSGLLSFDIGLSPLLVNMAVLSGLANLGTVDLNTVDGASGRLSISARNGLLQFKNLSPYRDFSLTFIG